MILIKADFVKNILTNKTISKNITPSFNGHKGKINGIISDPANNRVITYSEDGSFMIWEESLSEING